MSHLNTRLPRRGNARQRVSALGAGLSLSNQLPGIQHTCSASSATHNSRPAARMTILIMSDPVTP